MKIMPSPRIVDLEISSRCNLGCRYCYYLNNEGVRYHDLPTQKWLEFFRELGEAKVMEVCLGGGEPFLREDIFELIDGIERNRMRFQIVTNGQRVVRHTAIQLRKTRRCSFVQVSLDGSRPETHEGLRGVGSFWPALDAISILKEEGVPVTVRVTVHPYNIDDLPAIAELLLEKLAISHLSTNSVSSLGTRAKYGEQVFLRPADRLRAMAILAGLDKKYPGRIWAAAGPLASWKMFREMKAAQEKGVLIPGRGRLVGCGCIFNTVSVRADGAYVPCGTLPQMVLGYVGRDSLREVWLHSEQLNALRARTGIKLETFSECSGCKYLELCTGNCAGNAFSLLGDANRPGPDDCLRKFERDLAGEGLAIW